MSVIFTIGHSNYDPEVFLGLLREHAVEAVADVRSQPFSRRFPHFRKAQLHQLLKDAGIHYVFLGRELGARREETAAYVDGAVDYDRVAGLPAFAEGIQRLQRGAGRYRVALMCAERDPMRCHRALLVAPQLQRRGMEVNHILADGSLCAHQALEARLLEESPATEDLFDQRPRSSADAEKARYMARRRRSDEDNA